MLLVNPPWAFLPQKALYQTLLLSVPIVLRSEYSLRQLSLRDSACMCAKTRLCVVFQGNAHVRHLDWEESMTAGRLQQAPQLGDTNNTSTLTDTLQDQPGAPRQEETSSAPCVALEEKFEVVIGTDILYEVRPSQKCGSPALVV